MKTTIAVLAVIVCLETAALIAAAVASHQRAVQTTLGLTEWPIPTPPRLRVFGHPPYKGRGAQFVGVARFLPWWEIKAARTNEPGVVSSVEIAIPMF